MKLPDFAKLFEPLINDMGASEDQIDFKLSVGLEISISDPNLKITKDGFFYKGRRVLAYIRDQYSKYAVKGYKFHICDCKTLKTMQRAGRISRYVITTNTSGMFTVNTVVGNRHTKTEIEMKVCINCLTQLNYKRYSYNKRRVYEDFSIEEFFKSYEGFVGTPPTQNEHEPDVNVYPPNWDQIKRGIKNGSGWTCKECGIILDGSGRQFLDVHHIDSNKANNSANNLMAICIRCHSKKPAHGWVKANPRLRKFETLYWG